MNVLAFYHEWRSLIGYATHYLSIYFVIDSEITAASWSFQRVSKRVFR